MAKSTLTSKSSEPSFPTKVLITSNNKKLVPVDLIQGFVRLEYRESVLQDSIKVNYFFADAGGVQFFKKPGSKSDYLYTKNLREGLPLVGTEDVRLEFEDKQEVKLKVNLNVNKITPIYEDAGKEIVNLSLVSEEFIRNEEASARVKIRYDGNITDNVERILKDNLKTKKKLNLEPTLEAYNFFGNGRKPFYMLNYLSKSSVPTGGSDGNGGTAGKTDEKKNWDAGFLFFETAKGYHFKSISKLFSQAKKKSFIYNESTDKAAVPAGYDGKILEQSSDNAINAQQKMMMGAYNTKLILFDPFNCEYKVIKQNAAEKKVVKGSQEMKAKGIQTAGKNLPYLNEKFDTDYTRTTYMLVDTGSLPTGEYKEGSTGKEDEQVKKNDKNNFRAAEVLNQAIRRYNQMFSAMQEITIAGDFSLHAGDVVYVDIPSIKEEKDDTVDKQSGGLYIIADLCHLVTPDGTWTKLNLARDSFGRRGNHSTR